MQWSISFVFNKKCSHNHVPIDDDICYCPDCGELIQNNWYIARCTSCGRKLTATIKNGEIRPDEKFCPNCGCSNYAVEKIDKIDCININYAVLKREIVNTEIKEYIQSWSEVIRTLNDKPKLLK